MTNYKVNKIRPKGYGHYEISVTYRGKEVTGVTTNTQAIDRINSEMEMPNRKYAYGYTLRQADRALYNEVMTQYKRNK